MHPIIDRTSTTPHGSHYLPEVRFSATQQALDALDYIVAVYQRDNLNISDHAGCAIRIALIDYAERMGFRPQETR